MSRNSLLLLVQLVFLFNCGQLPAQEFFKGKTVTIIVGYPSGGGVDGEARLLARFLGRHIPGNPTLIVRNMPGAGGMVAANWFESLAKADGLTLQYISSSSITQQVFGGEGVKFDLKNWELLGSIVRSTSVGMVRQQVFGGEGVKFDLKNWELLGSIVKSTSVGMVRPEKLDRLTDPSKPALAVGSRTGDDSWNTMYLWGAEYLKWNVRWILGYGGGGEMRLAFQRGESDLYASANLPGLQELIAAGFHPFVQQGRLGASGNFQRRPEFPKVPTFAELIDKKRPAGVPWQAYVSWAGADGAGQASLRSRKNSTRCRAAAARSLFPARGRQGIHR